MLLSLGIVTTMTIVFALFIAVTRSRLPYWTGEEELLSQVRGVLDLLQTPTRPQPRVSVYMPVENVNICPFGVNTFFEQEVEYAKIERGMRMIRDAGFCWIRQEFPWEDIEIHGKGDFLDLRNEQPRDAWEKYDWIVELAEKYDLQIIARLDNPPAWSRRAGNENGTLAPPDDLADFGDYVETVVTRYRGRITHYQIWNEPNVYPEWGERDVNPREYVELLKVGYTRAKAVDPDLTILCGALASTIELDYRGLNDFAFLQQMYDAGARDYFDVMAVQGYGLWSGPYDRRMRPRVLNFSRPLYVREIMVHNGDAHKPIWMTEMNWNAIPADHPAYPHFGRVTEEQQARYAVDAYRRAQEEWQWVGVVSMWFFKRASDYERDQPMYYFRLVEPDFTSLPVYAAVKAYTAQARVVYSGYHQIDHWALDFAGNWERVLNDNAVLDDYWYSESGGTIAGRFKGKEVELVIAKSPDYGELQVQIDDRAPITIPLNTASPQRNVTIPIARGLSYTEHELKITASPRAAIDSIVIHK